MVFRRVSRALPGVLEGCEFVRSEGWSWCVQIFDFGEEFCGAGDEFLLVGMGGHCVEQYSR